MLLNSIYVTVSLKNIDLCFLIHKFKLLLKQHRYNSFLKYIFMLLNVIYILYYSLFVICVFFVFFWFCFLNDVPTFKITLIDPLRDKTNDLGFATSED